MTIAGVTEVLRGHDLVVVMGAQVFRYYPYVARYLPEGTELLQIIPPIRDWPPRRRSATACWGTRCWRWSSWSTWSMITAIGRSRLDRPNTAAVDVTGSAPLEPDAVWSTLRTITPADSPLVTESTSTMAQQLRFLPSTRPGSFFATASGGIGWGLPAAVGVALGDRARGVKRHVLATIGDGSFQYSVQALYTAAQHKLPIVFVAMRNGEYSIRKSFAVLEKTPACRHLTCPGSTLLPSHGFGCRAVSGQLREVGPPHSMPR